MALFEIKMAFLSMSTFQDYDFERFFLDFDKSEMRKKKITPKKQKVMIENLDIDLYLDLGQK